MPRGWPGLTPLLPRPAAFYTSRYGYKMCLRAYLNGDGTGRGTHLSLFFVLMRGPHDALLRWPFNQKVRGAPGQRVASVAARHHGAWRASSENLCARAAGSRAEAGTRV